MVDYSHACFLFAGTLDAANIDAVSIYNVLRYNGPGFAGAVYVNAGNSWLCRHRKYAVERSRRYSQTHIRCPPVY